MNYKMNHTLKCHICINSSAISFNYIGARLQNEDKIIDIDDIIIEKNTIHHGRGKDNPVNFLRFLPKSQSTKLFESPDDLPTARAKSEREYECAIPRAFLQRTLRIFSRSNDPSQTEFIKTCYYQY